MIDEVDASRRERRLPSVEKLESLGLPEIFSRALIERLGYTRGLQDKRIMWAAGPFPGLKDAAYVFTAADEHEARRVIEEDPLYRTGFIEPDFVLRRWLARFDEGLCRRLNWVMHSSQRKTHTSLLYSSRLRSWTTLGARV